MKHGKIIGVIYLASKSLVDFAVRSASHVPIYSDPSQFNTPTFHSATPALECHPALPQAHLIPSHLVFAEPPTARLPASTSTLRNTCGVRGQASVFFSVLQEKDWGSRGGWPEAVDPMHRGLAQEGQSLNRSPPQLWKWGKTQNKGKSPGWVGAFLQVESSGLSSYTVGGTRWPAAPTTLSPCRSSTPNGTQQQPDVQLGILLTWHERLQWEFDFTTELLIPKIAW